ESCGEWSVALGLLVSMGGGIGADVVSYNSAMSVCEKSSQWQQAAQLLSSMPAARLDPNVISYSAALSACARSCAWRSALGLLGAMRAMRLGPNAACAAHGTAAVEQGAQFGWMLWLMRSGELSVLGALRQCFSGV
ncbi:unnamed protein product, partial [Effrenium voratum]